MPFTTPSFRACCASLLATLLPLAGLRAQAPTLSDVVAEALRANADLALARARLDSAHAERTIARALPPFAAASVPQVPWQYSVSAPLDLGPQRYYRTSAAGDALRAADADAAFVRRDVTFAVRQAFADVLLAEALREIVREDRGIFARVLAADSARQRAGDIPARDVTKAEVELARAEAALTRADAQVHQARLALQQLMGRTAPDTGFTVRGDLAYRPVPVPDSLLALATRRRADVRAADDRVAQSRSLDRLATASVLPVPTASLVYQNGAPFTNGSQYALGVGVQLPLLYWNQGERERSRAGIASAEANAQKVRAQVAADVAAALDALRQAQALTERFSGGLVARSASALESAQFAYRSGASSFLDLVDAVRTFAAVRSDDVTARHDYWVALYALERATATEIVR